MALLRGLIDESTLRRALDSEQAILEALQAQGSLDAQDLEDLAHLVAQESRGHSGPREESQPPTHPAAPGQDPWDSLPSAGEETDGTGRQVLRVLTLPAWKQYRNLRFLAEGGMGRVFKAFDPSLRRVVALKFLRREDPELVARFRLEAQHQAGVDHPNICKVFEVGEWQGQSYIAMQFIKGETLEAAAPGLSLIDRVSVMEAVAEAVHAAHRQGLIHRDLKPANILVEAGEHGPKPTILDFGLAKGLESTGLTVQGLVIGTTHYMAPEQARGDHAAVGRRTDVYGLGATLHKVLTGQAPFSGSGGVDVLRRTQEEDVPSLIRLVPGFPEDLDTIVRKCLEKDPGRRYESSLALAEDLRRWREGEPILARKPTLRYRAGKWAARNRLLVGVVGAALVALLTTGAMGLRASLNAHAQARYAQHFGQEAERIEAFLRYAHLLRAHDIRPELAQARARMAALETEARRAGRLASGPADYALGCAHFMLGELDPARRSLERAWAEGFRTAEVSLALGRVYGALYQREAEAARRIAEPELRELKFKELETSLRRPALERLQAGASASLASPLYQRALLAFHGGHWEEALALARRAGEEQPWLYEARLREGDILLAQAQAPEHADPWRTRELTREAGRAFREAGRAFREAQVLAPSDPQPCLRDARRAVHEMDLDREEGREVKGHLAEARADLQRAEALLPGDPAILELKLRATTTWVMHQSNRGQLQEAEVREAIALARARLAQGPSAEVLRILRNLWEILALGAFRRGEDPDPLLEQARQAIGQARALDPADPVLAFRQGLLEARQVALDASRGRAPWTAFERGLRAMEEAARSAPGSLRIPGTMAELWMERAEFERLHGLDPRPSCREARRALAEPLAREPRFYRWQGTLGSAWMIEGQHQLALGQEARPALESALEAFRREAALKPDLAEPLVDGADGLLALAEGALEGGGDPGSRLGEARSLLARAHALQPGYDHAWVQRARLELLAAGASLSGVGKVAPSPGGLARARNQLRGAFRVPKPRLPAQLVRAELAFWEARSGRSGAHAEGVAACDAALAMNPNCGEAWLWRGGLEALRGRKAEARAAWARALELNANLARRLERLKALCSAEN